LCCKIKVNAPLCVPVVTLLNRRLYSGSNAPGTLEYCCKKEKPADSILAGLLT